MFVCFYYNVYYHNYQGKDRDTCKGRDEGKSKGKDEGKSKGKDEDMSKGIVVNNNSNTHSSKTYVDSPKLLRKAMISGYFAFSLL